MKEKKIDQLIKSNRSLATYHPVTGKVVFPDIDRVRGMTSEQISNLKFTSVAWYQDMVATIGLFTSDGQEYRAGTAYEYNCADSFRDQKIVKVEVYLYEDRAIGQINFYMKDGNLVQLGSNSCATGARDIFEISENEQLIGCELETCKNG